MKTIARHKLPAHLWDAYDVLQTMLDDHYRVRMQQGRENLDPRTDVITGIMFASLSMMKQLGLNLEEVLLVANAVSIDRGWKQDWVLVVGKRPPGDLGDN